MLFVLDSSILAVDPNCVEHNRALETLLGAYQSREHLLFMDMPELLALTELIGENLSISGRSVLTSLHNRIPEYGVLLGVIDYKIVVYLEGRDKKGIYREGSTWYVPLRNFSGSGLISSAVLGENELDSELYIQFAMHYIAREKIRGFRVLGRSKSGGGSGTPRSLTSYMRNEYSPCLCITDSDKYHPGYKKSATAKNCGLAARTRNRVVEYICLEEREVENLLPIELLGKIVDLNRFSREIDDAGVNNGDCWKYLDLKEGLSLEWIQKQNDPTRYFWRNAETHLSRKKRNCVFCKNADEDLKSKCGCGRVDGLGSGILDNAVKYLSTGEPRLSLRLLEQDLRWKEIGKAVFDFTIAPVGEMIASA